MDIWIIVAAGAVVLVAGAILALGLRARSQHRTTDKLQKKFGSEYGKAVDGAGRKKGEADLANRQERVEALPLRDLNESESERFTGLWTATQARFVDEPGGAVTDADRLLNEVMLARGYPVGDFEQRAADVSVNHPQFVSNYRAAHGTAVKHSRGQTSTEELRQAMVHYRWLFTDLVGEGQTTQQVSPA